LPEASSLAASVNEGIVETCARRRAVIREFLADVGQYREHAVHDGQRHIDLAFIQPLLDEEYEDAPRLRRMTFQSGPLMEKPVNETDSLPRIQVRDMFMLLRLFDGTDETTLENCRLRLCTDRKGQRRGDYLSPLREIQRLNCSDSDFSKVVHFQRTAVITRGCVITC